MRLQPRQELLSVWKAITEWCGPADSFRWADRDGSNSISDAELLLCLLLPPLKLPDIRYDRPDQTEAGVRTALAGFGSPVEISQRVVGLLGEFMTRHSDPETGLPTFAAGNYLTTAPGDEAEPTPEQLRLEVVDSFATSIALCLSALRFLRGYRRQVQRGNHLEEIARVEIATQKRLTAAMAGLQRSFTVSVFESNSPEGRALRENVYPGLNLPNVVRRIREALTTVEAGLSELGVNAEQVEDLRLSPNKLFECGWSWGVVQGADMVKTQPGYAEPVPYLYFTVVAVDGIRDLLAEETRLEGLLTEEQRALSNTLKLQWELAQRYWSTIATMGEQRWPVEELPWRTTAEAESDYYSLLVLSLVRHALGDRNAPQADLTRVGRVLEDLADRGRIRRRPLANDPALDLHQPGRWVHLGGATLVGPDAPRVGRRLGELSSLVFGRALALAAQVNDSPERARLIALADDVWEHLKRRRLRHGRGADLWDDPANVFPSLIHRDEPSWYHTLRVVRCMGVAAELIRSDPPPGPALAALAAELLAEAQNVFAREQLRGSGEGGPALRDSLNRQSINLSRARQMLRTQPGTASVHLLEVLRELDRLAAVRENQAGI
ncbi:SCO2524 family protein [Actinoplanes sichuanensis]|uniref:SCO2524 family protein n=1 Tax=Actinoplanes sichuanensis TaxID=512349 RepID=A0ABW4ARG7_9ACTN|nr:SCO2524 family protein [Actinoplanes sichuanensis]BEL07387.1 SCO2524 family protein [Actinoplanes sichuanensis]